MTETAIVILNGKKGRKEIRKSIQEKLSVTLADYKLVIGEKKFESRIRKAARSLGSDILRSMPKKRRKIDKLVDQTA